jgi:outer membrane protein OmpA-like peptidoglycan-associated protein
MAALSWGLTEMVAKVVQGGEASSRLVPSLVVAVGLASATLGAVMATSAVTTAQEAATGNTPATTADPDAVRRPATIEDAFPNLGAVPGRPTPSLSATDRAAITNSLIGDRNNARHTAESLRGGQEAAAPSPRSLPPVAASELRDPNEERRRVADETGQTAFGSYQQRANGAQVPPPLPVTPEAQTYATRAVPVPSAGGMAAGVPRSVARPSAAPATETAAAAPESVDPAAPRTDAVRPLRVPPTVASLPAPAGQAQREIAAGPTPQVIASINSPPAARPAAARPAATAVAAAVPTAGSRYAPPAATPSQPALRVAGGAAPAVAPRAPVTVAAVEARPLAPSVAGGSRELAVRTNAPPGVVVNDVYLQQLAETRRPTSVPVSMPQFEVSTAPALPSGSAVPMSPAMQAALGSNGATRARAPVRLDIPAEATRPQAAVAPAPRRAAVAADGSTVIGFAAGSIDLTPAARESIRQMAAALHSGVSQVRIVGYARSRGDAADSVEAFGLSIDRANAVAAELMAAGVPPRAVKVEAIVADAGAATARARGKGPEAVVFLE